MHRSFDARPFYGQHYERVQRGRETRGAGHARYSGHRLVPFPAVDRNRGARCRRHAPLNTRLEGDRGSREGKQMVGSRSHPPRCRFACRENGGTRVGRPRSRVRPPFRSGPSRSFRRSWWSASAIRTVAFASHKVGSLSSERRAVRRRSAPGNARRQRPPRARSRRLWSTHIGLRVVEWWLSSARRSHRLYSFVSPVRCESPLRGRPRMLFQYPFKR